jgi:bifunctional DNase/RNase
MVKVCPVGIVGPLPSEVTCPTVLVALSNKDKIIVVPCPYGDGCAAAKMMANTRAARGPCGPYDFVPDLMRAVGATLEMALLSRQDDEFMSSVYVTPPGGTMVKMSSDNPGIAINFALSGDCPLYVEESAWRAATDAAKALVDLGSYMSLWPLPALNKTDSLRMFSDFMDNVMPSGRVFGKKRINE